MDTVEVCCEACNGSGYKHSVLEYRLNGKNIVEVMAFSIADACSFFADTNIQPMLNGLCEVGLEYLTLGQSLKTLSGGERQRLKLAIQLNKKGCTYVFDEPTTGLHGSDIAKIIKLFDKMVDEGSTVIIIEHNLDVVSQADWIIDMGLGAGRNGGEIIFEGYPKNIVNDKISLTGTFLRSYIK